MIYIFYSIPNIILLIVCSIWLQTKLSSPIKNLPVVIIFIHVLVAFILNFCFILLYFDIANVELSAPQYLFARGQLLFAIINTIMIFKGRKKLRTIVSRLSDRDQINEVQTELDGNNYMYAIGFMWLLAVLSLFDIISVAKII